MEKFYILAFLMPFAVLAEKPAEHMVVTWKSFDCETNPDFIVSSKCTILSPGRNLLNAEITLTQTLQKVSGSLTIYFPRGNTKEFHKIVGVTFNICEFEKNRKINRFVSIAYNSLTKNSNLPKKCPQPKGFYYYRNINVAEQLPLFLPNSEFKVQLNVFTLHSSIFNISLSGTTSRQ